MLSEPNRGFRLCDSVGNANDRLIRAEEGTRRSGSEDRGQMRAQARHRVARLSPETELSISDLDDVLLRL